MTRTSPSPAALAVWTGLIRASTDLQGRIEAALRAQSLPPLAWYDALWEIEKAGADGIRPFALQDRLLLPQYGLSRLIDRMVKAGYVDRRACDGDGRGQVLHLTGEGAQMRAAMWPVYATSLKAAVENRLTEAEAEALAQLIKRLIG